LREKPNTDRSRAPTGRCHRQIASGKGTGQEKTQTETETETGRPERSCSLSKEDSKTGLMM
jgi:hypothetical protein